MGGGGSGDDSGGGRHQRGQATLNNKRQHCSKDSGCGGGENRAAVVAAPVNRQRQLLGQRMQGSLVWMEHDDNEGGIAGSDVAAATDNNKGGT